MWTSNVVGKILEGAKVDEGKNRKPSVGSKKYLCPVTREQTIQEEIAISLIGPALWSPQWENYYEIAPGKAEKSEALVTNSKRRTNNFTASGRLAAHALYLELSKANTDAHRLIDPYDYGEQLGAAEYMSQPYKIDVHPQVGFLCDIHGHLSEAEVIGLLAGKWDADQKRLYIQAPFPCAATERHEDFGFTDVELDPEAEWKVREAIAALGLEVVGWYHSHPKFKPSPSVMDIFNQQQYQQYTRDEKTGDEPFVGLIVSTYDAQLTSAQSDHQWFTVVPFVPSVRKNSIVDNDCNSEEERGGGEDLASDRRRSGRAEVVKGTKADEQGAIYMPVRMSVNYHSVNLEAALESTVTESKPTRAALGASASLVHSGVISEADTYSSPLLKGLMGLRLESLQSSNTNTTTRIKPEEVASPVATAGGVELAPARRKYTPRGSKALVGGGGVLNAENLASLNAPTAQEMPSGISGKSNKSDPTNSLVESSSTSYEEPEARQTMPETSAGAASGVRESSSALHVPSSKTMEGSNDGTNSLRGSLLGGVALGDAASQPDTAGATSMMLECDEDVHQERKEDSVVTSDLLQKAYSLVGNAGATGEADQSYWQGLVQDEAASRALSQLFPALSALSKGMKEVVRSEGEVQVEENREAECIMDLEPVQEFPIAPTPAVEEGKSDYFEPATLPAPLPVIAEETLPQEALEELVPLEPVGHLQGRARRTSRDAKKNDRFGDFVDTMEATKHIRKQNMEHVKASEQKQKLKIAADKAAKKAQKILSPTKPVLPDTATAETAMHQLKKQKLPTTAVDTHRKTQSKTKKTTAENCEDCVIPFSLTESTLCASVTAPKRAKGTKVEAVEAESVYTSIILALQDTERPSSALAREMLCSVVPQYRGLVLVVISVGMYYARSPRRVDLLKNWKGLTRVEKIKSSAAAWLHRLGLKPEPVDALSASSEDGTPNLPQSDPGEGDGVTNGEGNEAEKGELSTIRAAGSSGKLTGDVAMYRLTEWAGKFLLACWEDYAKLNRKRKSA